MLTNMLILDTLRHKGIDKGAIHVDSPSMRSIRIPGGMNIGSIEEAADALTAIGIEVRGYGANLNCQHDDFVGGTIMFCLDADAQLPTDTNSRMRA